MPDLALLFQFSVLAETLSFTGAARQLGVAQPWLSARIRKLETQLGISLFDRTTRRVSLTREGEELARLLASYAAEVQKLATLLKQFEHDQRNIVRVGCTPLGAPDPQQAELFSRIRKDYPSTMIEVEPSRSQRHFEQLRTGGLDVALTVFPPAGSEWESKPLYRLSLALMMHAKDPLANVQPLRAQQLVGRRIATYSRRAQPDVYDLLYAPLQEAGAILTEVPELRRSLLRDNRDLIVSTIVPAPADAVLKYDIVRRELDDMAELRLHAVRYRQANRTSAAAGFWKVLTRSFV